MNLLCFLIILDAFKHLHVAVDQCQSLYINIMNDFMVFRQLLWEIQYAEYTIFP